MPKQSKNYSNPETVSDRLPPQNIEAEQSVLGSLMLDKDAIIKVADILAAEDFYKGAHQKIFEAMTDLYARREPIDLLSLSSHLKEKNEIDEIGGIAYLTTLVNSVPTAAHIVHYAKIVRKKSVLRNLISASYEIQNLSYQETGDVEELLDEVERKIFKISQKSVGQQFLPIKEALPSVLERIEKLQRGDKSLRGVPTGFAALDTYLGGLQKSDFVVLAARPSLGKTSLALDIARHAALEEKIPVGVFSLEMSSEQLIERFIAAEARIDLWRLRTGKLENKEKNFSEIRGALDRLAESPLFLDDSALPNVMQIRTAARRLQAEHGLGLLIVDYIQMILPRSSYENMVQQMTEISRSLKALAKELNVPLLAISQLSRAVEHRSPGDRIPRLADLRESGAIEQDADVVLFIYREDKDKGTSDNSNIAKIIIAKHRNGPTGEVHLSFIPDRATFDFRDVDKTHSDESFSATRLDYNNNPGEPF